MIKGNKGEWSEIYTLFKIISDRNLYPGDANLEKISGLLYPIVKVLRDETLGSFEFEYDSDIVIVRGKKEEFRIPVTLFKEQAEVLLSDIKSASSSTFEIPHIEAFINSFKCYSLKANSSVKTDIRVVIHDNRTSSNQELGFSIKSQLGGASTLLNAGKTTNFIFKLKNIELSENDIEQINAIDSRSKIMDRLSSIASCGGFLEFCKTESTVFSDNITLIDSALPQILATITHRFYTSHLSKLSDLVADCAAQNPLNFNVGTGQPFYEYKIKRLLTDIALGMMPSVIWTGRLATTGGYLVVKEDGEIICYHIYNRNEFENYLLKNTKLETASSTRHDFGVIYKENNELYIKLNLQIRFMK